jgi:RNA polymerase sigma-70 factor (ECF subfamily)
VEDLVQEAFVCLLERVGSVRNEAGLDGFVVAVTLNTVRLELRRRKRRRWFSLFVPLEERSTAMSATVEVKQLFAQLETLTVDQRLAFSLRHFEHLELTEVALAMDVSLATAKRRLSEARAALDAHFGEPGDEAAAVRGKHG